MLLSVSRLLLAAQDFLNQHGRMKMSQTKTHEIRGVVISEEDRSVGSIEEIGRNKSQVVAYNPGHLLQMALEKNASMEQVEKLMDLQERFEKNEARKAYNRAFSAFKAEVISIIKTAKTTSGPLTGRIYADKNDVVMAVTPALSRHGLSSSWKITKDEKDWIEVTCYLRHEAGHEESVSMGGPPDVGGAKSAIQARASANSYLERYTLKAITGLSEKGEDNDGGKLPEDKPEKKTKALPIMNEKGYKRAVDAIKTGQYTLAQIKEMNALTPDQDDALAQIEKESKK